MQMEEGHGDNRLGTGRLKMPSRKRRERRAQKFFDQRRFRLLVENSKIWRSQFSKCFAPTWDCTNPAIRAHSIQNSRIIDLLARDGHVKMIEPVLRPGSLPRFRFNDVGRNRASAFEGFCTDHDQALFRRIDSDPLTAPDEQQLFLLAYRAASRELHASFTAGANAQKSYESSKSIGMPEELRMSLGESASVQFLQAWLVFCFRSHFDEDIVVRRYDRVRHRIFNFKTSVPTFAVSSMFAVAEPPPGGHHPSFVTLSVFPCVGDGDDGSFHLARL